MASQERQPLLSERHAPEQPYKADDDAPAEEEEAVFSTVSLSEGSLDFRSLSWPGKALDAVV